VNIKESKVPKKGGTAAGTDGKKEFGEIRDVVKQGDMADRDRHENEKDSALGQSFQVHAVLDLLAELPRPADGKEIQRD